MNTIAIVFFCISAFLSLYVVIRVFRAQKLDTTDAIGLLGVAIAIALGFLAKTDVATLPLTRKPTPGPTIEPTRVPDPGQDWLTNCISVLHWVPYSDRGGKISAPTAIPEDHCWQLLNWGLSANNDGLLIFRQNPPTSEFYSIGTPIPENCIIEFDVKGEDLSSSSGLQFRISQLLPSGDPEGEVIIYYNASQIGFNTFTHGTMKAVSSFAAKEAKYHFRLEITGIRLTTIIEDANGDRISEPLAFPLPFSDRYFWIAYFVNKDDTVSSVVTNLSIQAK